MIRGFEELKQEGLRHVLDYVYFELVGLCIMYKDYEYSDKAAKYAKDTVIRSQYNNHRISSPDLYNLFAYLNNLHRFKKSKNDEILMKRASLDINFYTRYLRKMTNGALTPSEMDMFIRRITKELYIEDNILSSVGIMAIHWNTLSLDQKKLTLDKMKRYGIINFRRSDVLQDIKQFASEFKTKKTKPDPVPQKAEQPQKQQGNDLVKLGLAAAGGYALSKFLNRRKKNDNPYTKDPMDASSYYKK